MNPTQKKGTTSVVPLKSSVHAAAAAEVRFSGQAAIAA